MLRTDSGPKHLTFLTKLPNSDQRGGKKKDIVLYINNKNLVTKYYKTKCWIVSTPSKFQVYQQDHRSKNHFKVICFMKQ